MAEKHKAHREESRREHQSFLPILVKKDDKFYFNLSALHDVFNHRQLSEKKIAIVSICGPVRKGKSFLLNLFLKYWKEKMESVRADEYKLTGFEWRGGLDPCTSGVVISKKPIMISNLAVFLLDSQGLFEDSEDVDGLIFSFTTMISSIQIYNVSNQIDRTSTDFVKKWMEDGMRREADSRHYKMVSAPAYVKSQTRHENPGMTDFSFILPCVKKPLVPPRKNQRTLSSRMKASHKFLWLIRDSNTKDTGTSKKSKYLESTRGGKIDEKVVHLAYPGRTFCEQTQRDENKLQGIAPEFLKDFKELCTAMTKWLNDSNCRKMSQKDCQTHITEWAKRLNIEQSRQQSVVQRNSSYLKTEILESATATSEVYNGETGWEDERQQLKRNPHADEPGEDHSPAPKYRPKVLSQRPMRSNTSSSAQESAAATLDVYNGETGWEDGEQHLGRDPYSGRPGENRLPATKSQPKMQSERPMRSNTSSSPLAPYSTSSVESSHRVDISKYFRIHIEQELRRWFESELPKLVDTMTQNFVDLHRTEIDISQAVEMYQQYVRKPDANLDDLKRQSVKDFREEYQGPHGMFETFEKMLRQGLDKVDRKRLESSHPDTWL